MLVLAIRLLLRLVVVLAPQVAVGVQVDDVVGMLPIPMIRLQQSSMLHFLSVFV